jgi:hypothetical protein
LLFGELVVRVRHTSPLVGNLSIRRAYSPALMAKAFDDNPGCSLRFKPSSRAALGREVVGGLGAILGIPKYGVKKYFRHAEIRGMMPPTHTERGS